MDAYQIVARRERSEGAAPVTVGDASDDAPADGADDSGGDRVPGFVADDADDGSAGRLTATKGFSRLLHLLAQLDRQSVPAELTIVGDGSQREVLTALAGELGISERVRITGWVEPAALRQAFAASDVFCLLADTTYHDGLPNVVLEAQALGRPVLISSLPAAAEAVTHGVDGFVIEPDDTEGACRVLTQLAREPALRQRIAAAARARVERQHDARHHLGQLHQLLLSRSGAAA